MYLEYVTDTYKDTEYNTGMYTSILIKFEKIKLIECSISVGVGQVSDTRTQLQAEVSIIYNMLITLQGMNNNAC